MILTLRSYPHPSFDNVADSSIIINMLMLSNKEIIRNHFSSLGKKGGKKRWSKVPKKKRSEIMKQVRNSYKVKL